MAVAWRLSLQAAILKYTLLPFNVQFGGFFFFLFHPAHGQPQHLLTLSSALGLLLIFILSHFKDYISLHVCLSVSMCVMSGCSTHGDQRRTPNLWVLELGSHEALDGFSCLSEEHPGLFPVELPLQPQLLSVVFPYSVSLYNVLHMYVFSVPTTSC